MSSVSASPELRDKSELIERFLAMAGFTETPAIFDIDPDAPEEQRHEIVTATGADSSPSRWRTRSRTSSRPRT